MIIYFEKYSSLINTNIDQINKSDEYILLNNIFFFRHNWYKDQLRICMVLQRFMRKLSTYLKIFIVTI